MCLVILAPRIQDHTILGASFKSGKVAVEVVLLPIRLHDTWARAGIIITGAPLLNEDISSPQLAAHEP